ncbi:Carboxylesterase NlhH [Novipirellula aureliae]|uniref:Carboxylesterase NlhH n=1 Tax=Novipirellula aureliae TaxID=2527966 RepID=A0A5C6ED28_9BACT|nr:alpha/beta hydrolase [Novipirellula aureliae]TWU45466.1 Carboxylesterase NlhH [Novipirellula aureliae]
MTLQNNLLRPSLTPTVFLLVSALVGSSTAFVQAEGPSSLHSFLNERYSDSEGRAGLCDVYTPQGDPPKNGFATVIVIHGGAWMSGSKWVIQSYSRFLAQHGYAAVTINYRLAPEYPFPTQVDDVRQAALWVKQNSGRFHFDVDRLGLFGYSAGGHLSLMVSSLQDESAAAKLASSHWPADDSRWGQLPTFRAACVGGPPCDFRDLPLDNTTLAFFFGGSRREKPSAYEAASPIAYVSKDDPPVHIIHGESDLLVPIQTSVAFREAMQKAGASCGLTRLPDQGHAMAFLNPKTREEMRAFFDRTLTLPTK